MASAPADAVARVAHPRRSSEGVDLQRRRLVAAFVPGLVEQALLSEGYLGPHTTRGAGGELPLLNVAGFWRGLRAIYGALYITSIRSTRPIGHCTYQHHDVVISSFSFLVISVRIRVLSQSLLGEACLSRVRWDVNYVSL